MDVLTRIPDTWHRDEVALDPPVERHQPNFFARPHPQFQPFPLPRFTAWLNHTDRIICLPSHWDLFTAMIGSADLERERVLGRPISWFVEDETVRECFRVLLERTRREGRASRIVARCDSPGEARAMQIRFVPMSAGAIECSWSFFQGAPAEEIPNLRRHIFTPGEHLRMCGWCRQVHLHRGWQKLENAMPALGLLDHHPLPLITHGICPQCSATMARDTHDLRAV